MKFTTFRLLSLQMQYTKSEDDIDTVVFEMKLLMNDERQCQRRTIDDGGCRLVAISHLDESDDLKMIKVDRQTDDNFTGNRKCSLKSPDLDFPGEKKLKSKQKNI